MAISRLACLDVWPPQFDSDQKGKQGKRGRENKAKIFYIFALIKSQKLCRRCHLSAPQMQCKAGHSRFSCWVCYDADKLFTISAFCPCVTNDALTAGDPGPRSRDTAHNVRPNNTQKIVWTCISICNFCCDCVCVCVR